MGKAVGEYQLDAVPRRPDDLDEVVAVDSLAPSQENTLFRLLSYGVIVIRSMQTVLHLISQ